MMKEEVLVLFASLAVASMQRHFVWFSLSGIGMGAEPNCPLLAKNKIFTTTMLHVLDMKHVQLLSYTIILCIHFIVQLKESRSIM